DDYYLYRHAFDVAASGQGTVLGDPLIPPGAPQVDEIFGETETYRNAVTVRVPLEDPPANAMVPASVAFQGCADVGVCYPPHRQRVNLRLPDRPAASTSGADLSSAFGSQSGTGNALDSLLGNPRQA